MNRVTLLGNLTRDVELRYTQAGAAIAKFSIATNRRWKDKNGEIKEEVMFINVNAFGRAAEIANQFLAKGRQILLEGSLVLEQWTDSNGQKRQAHSVRAENIHFTDHREVQQLALASTNDDEEAPY